MKWYKVSVAETGNKPFIRKAKAGNKTICLVGYENRIYALSARCPHAGGDLTGGWCKDGKLICPVHRYSFDLMTGRGSEGQNDFIESYPVEIRNNEVYVGVTSFWEKIKQGFKS